MGFFTDLGKGFIRSAVNQVGRDTGKVFSNQIYGDAHSTPIRNVGITSRGEYVSIDAQEPINVHELRKRAEQDGWVPNYSTYPLTYNSVFGWFVKILVWGVMLFAGISLYPFSMLIPVIPLVLLINGIIKIFKNKVVWQRQGCESVYVSDRRYRSGHKTEFRDTIQKVQLPCNKKDKKINRIYGIIDIVLAAALSFGAYHYGELGIRDSVIHNCEKIISQRESIVNDSINDYKDIKQYKEMGGTYYEDRMIKLHKKYEGKYEEYINAVNKLDSINNIK